MRISRSDERVACLRSVALFSDCTKAELNGIAALTTEHTVKSGKTLTERGEPGMEFFVIVEGWAVVNRDGRRLSRIGPGSFVGELALLDRGDRTATVVAETDMRLLVMSRREFNSLRSSVPSVADRMLVEMAARLRDTDSMLDRGPGAHAEPPILTVVANATR